MARGARKISELGLYHVIIRGVARQVIFYEDLDRIMYLSVLNRYVCEDFLVFGYCLMDNHIHLIVKSYKLSEYIKRIGISYVWWYNTKNERVGHLYQNRFISEVINTESYLLRCLRYIHNNPVKAGLCQHPNSFQWSSSHLYFSSKETFVNTKFIENMFNSKDVYSEFMGLEDEDFYEASTKNKIGNKRLEQFLQAELGGKSVYQLTKEEKLAIANSLIDSHFINKKHLSKLLAIPYRYLFP